jgi:hypothetical protein
MPERTVRILGFNYTDGEGIERMATRGQTLDFSDDDATRGDESGAFALSDEEAAVAGEASISAASTDEELIEFAKTAKVGEVVEAAGGAAEFAKRLLEAENGATGNDPRKGVAEGLAAVVGEV